MFFVSSSNSACIYSSRSGLLSRNSWNLNVGILLTSCSKT
jgi:hypothetical protein